MKTITDVIAAEILRQKPGHAYVSASGTELYVLIPGTDDIIVFTGPDFGSLTEDQCNDYIVGTLSKFTS